MLPLVIFVSCKLYYPFLIDESFQAFRHHIRTTSLTDNLCIFDFFSQNIVSIVHTLIYSIGKSCQMTQSVSYRECWERSVGQRGALAVSILNILDPLLGIYANATILSI